MERPREPISLAYIFRFSLLGHEVGPGQQAFLLANLTDLVGLGGQVVKSLGVFQLGLTVDLALVFADPNPDLFLEIVVAGTAIQV